METLEGAELCFPHLLNASCRKNTHPRSEVVLLYILMSSISVLTVALNLLVIISISHYRQLHTPTNLFVLSLAVSDLLVGLLLMPGQTAFIHDCWFLGDLVCAMYYLLCFTVTTASIGNMVLISVDRYVAICDPLCYPTKITLRRVKVGVCLCWICSVLCSSLIQKDSLIQPGRYNSCHGDCALVLNYITGAVDLVLTFIGPITVIIVLYMRVFVVAVSQARSMRSHFVSVTLQPSGTGTAKKSELKAARTLGIVIAVFLICFCPSYYPSLAGQETSTQASYLKIVLWMFYCNSSLNPLIYAFFYPWFRKSVKLIVTLQILQPGSCGTNIL
ncbi:trace amine-associated receptor 13c-like [Myripristis murdjan]|uniref:trace amine-associated receptor 13c-like n=1 Tax=Myripristis murdjan TaxID=586833 RepID=UPI0011761B0E|nr:trace amine-associated receptor 13c-like [Myripristis murdjan]